MNDAINLEPPLSGVRRELRGRAGDVGYGISYYTSGPDHASDEQQRPLILIHSVNAVASAYEVKPLYDYYCRQRPVAALDLPGFGLSARPDQLYTPRVMTDAVLALVEAVAQQTGAARVDAVALSLSCEFLARAAFEAPEHFHSLAFVSPTGFSGDQRRDGPLGSNRGKPWIYKAVAGSSRVGRGLFRTLTSRPSIRYFLRKTWGSRDIDEGVFEYACASARVPGARHAPFCFLSGYLFSADISRIYEALPHPVWMALGSRGDFTDHRRSHTVEQRKNWQIRVYDTGALPHFEILDAITRDYDQFLVDVERGHVGSGGVPDVERTGPASA